MQTTPSLPSDTPGASTAWLWTRAAALMAALLVFIGSPARLIRSPTSTRRQRRALNRMIAPIEALVRSLLMSDAIAFLTGTEEGAEMLRTGRAEAGGDTQPATPAHAIAIACEGLREDPTTDDMASPAADGEATDADTAKMLAPKRLRFRPYEFVHPGYVVSGDKRKPADPAHPPRRRISPIVKLARRIAALRLIIANRRQAMLALARDLAARPLHDLYVPSPRNWIDERWVFGHGEIRDARRISSARFRDFEKTRSAPQAPPQPEPD